MTMPKIKAGWAVTSAVAIALGTSSGIAHGQTDKEQELEARIEELERMVRELQQGRPAQPAPPQTAEPHIQTAPITPNAAPNTRFLFSGFIKLDALYSDYDDGEIADGSIGRDFYLPGTIPVGGAAEDPDFDSHIKQSRFIFGTDTGMAGGNTLSSRLEVDLYGSSLGDERATNTYGVQLRHAYFQYGHWLAGQTWSTFQDVAALPESADFIGPTDGTIFVRQPQVRYTSGNFSVAAENPEATLTPFGGGARVVSDDGNVPDLTAAYTFKIPRGYVRAAGLARQIKYQTTGLNANTDTSFGGALSLSGKINFGPHDLRFMLTGGDGFGRYVGVNFNNDAALDANGNLHTLSGWAGFAAWRQAWNAKLRSTLMLSFSSYDNDPALTGLGANKSSQSWAINTFYTPIPKLDLGIELRQAQRELESGAEGDMLRLHAVAKYSF